jgi:hypothetical protein
MKKMLTTGVGYSGRAALRREQCDVHAMVLFRGSKGGYLVMTIHETMDVSLESISRNCLLYGPVPGYISRTMTWQWGSYVLVFQPSSCRVAEKKQSSEFRQWSSRELQLSEVYCSGL